MDSTPDTDFYAIGRRAFQNGEPAAPALNPTVDAAIAGLPVGGGAAAIFREFQRGWMDANFQQPDPATTGTSEASHE